VLPSEGVQRSSRLELLALSTAVALATLAGASMAACSELRIADPAAEGGPSSSDEASTDSPSGGPGQEGGPAADGGSGTDGATGPLFYDAVQAKLEAKRFPGPTTAQGSNGYCTSKYFVWKESDGTLHSWAAQTQGRLDYAFKVQTRPYFVPADTFIAVDTPSFTNIAVYHTNAANDLVTSSIPYSFNFVAANDGVILLDQKIGTTDLMGTKVRRWNAGTGLIEDISAVLTGVKQPPSSFVNDAVVIPASVTIPFALYIVDVLQKTTTSVTFDGALGLQQTEQSAPGLVVAYPRSGGVSAIRLYKGDHDDAVSRFEIGDDVANRGPYFQDGPPGEHKFIARITTWGQKVLYSSAFGIWSYDVPSGAIAPVQLAANKKVGVPDVMCVVKDAGLLMYRLPGDTLGQVWAVPLASVIPP
jgi:hypothetical protein